MGWFNGVKDRIPHNAMIELVDPTLNEEKRSKDMDDLATKSKTSKKLKYMTLSKFESPNAFRVSL